MSSFALKILAIILMTIDHIGYILYPQISILRVIGRLSFPIFAFQITNGFIHTKSKEIYIFRMLLFTIVSELPFLIAVKSANPNQTPFLNIGATLTCGLLALYCIEKFNKLWLKYLFTILIVLLPIYVPMDYGWYGVLTIVLFYIFRNYKTFTAISYFFLLTLYCSYKASIFNLPAILALIPIFLYNGKKGKNAKYLFYIFYPLHLLILVYLSKIL